jgi:opacity protein-like surface antigen
MKKSVIFLSGFFIFLANIPIFAATPGFYLGGDLGYSRLETPDTVAFLPTGSNTKNSRNMGGFGVLLFTGYNINQYLGIELGYLHLADSTYEATQNGQNASLKYTGDGAKLVGKLNLPLKYQFEVFGEAGVGCIWQRVDYSNPNNIPLNARSFKTPKNGKRIYWQARTAVGAGVKYHLSDAWALNIAWNMIILPNNFRSDERSEGSAQFVGAGIEYSF